MIDILSLLISHGVILLAAWQLLPRSDLANRSEDRENRPPPQEPAGDA